MCESAKSERGINGDSVPPIETKGLTRLFRGPRRQPVRALQDLDVRIAPGEIVGLLGPNGSGKSTTMKILLGLLRPSSGTARVLGRAPGHRPTLGRVGYLPEQTRLFGFLSARETVRFFGSLSGLSRRRCRQEADRRLEEFELTEVANRRVSGFSKGMARRLGLASALVGDPVLVILDEPTSGLDPLGAAEVKAHIRRLREAGRTVLLSSHLLADVEGTCDRILLLGSGRLLRSGPPGELLALRDEYEARFKGGEPGFAERIRDLIEAEGAEQVRVRPATEDLEQLFLRVFRDR